MAANSATQGSVPDRPDRQAGQASGGALRVKIAATLMFAGVAPLAIVLLLYLAFLEPRLKQGVLREQQQLALEVGAVLNRNLFERKGDVEAFALNPLARDRSLWSRPGDGALVEAMDGYVRLYGMYRLTVLMSPEGKVLAMNHVDAQGRPLATEALIGKSMAGETWFAQLPGPALPAMTILPAQKVPFIGALYGDGGDVVPFVAPVRGKDGRVLALWINFFDLAKVETITRDMVDQRQQVQRSDQRFQIIDAYGKPIFDSQNARVLSIEPQVAALLASRAPAAPAVAGVVGHETVAAAPAPPKFGFAGPGWTAVVREQSSVAFAPVIAVRRSVIAAVVATTLAMLAFGLWCGRRLADPILELAGRMRSLAAGDRSSPVRHSGRSGDIGRMAQALEVFRKALVEKEMGQARQLLAMEASNLGAWEFDTASGTLMWDARALAILGAAPDAKVDYETFLSLLPPTDRQRMDAMFRDALRPGAASLFHAEYRIAGLGDGGERWISARGRPLIEDGVVTRMIGTIVDVTDRTTADARLSESEHRRQLAMEVAEIGAWEYDPRTNQLTADRRSSSIASLSLDAPVPFETWLEGVHPGDRAYVQAQRDAALDPEGPGVFEAEYRVIRRGDERWSASVGKTFFDGGRPVRLIGVVMDITARKRAELNRELLVNELNHRVKNSLATVQAIAHFTLAGEADVDAAREAFICRIAALARAHDILTRRNWADADLHEVLGGVVDSFSDERRGRMNLAGPPVRLKPKAALAIATATFELATNAAKYGALSVPEGDVDIGWTVEDQTFRLEWRERGGPPVSPPRNKGFGSRLIQQGLAGELGGKARTDYAGSGVIFRFEAPLSPLLSTP